MCIRDRLQCIHYQGIRILYLLLLLPPCSRSRGTRWDQTYRILFITFTERRRTQQAKQVMAPYFVADIRARSLSSSYDLHHNDDHIVFFRCGTFQTPRLLTWTLNLHFFMTPYTVKFCSLLQPVVSRPPCPHGMYNPVSFSPLYTSQTCLPRWRCV